MLFLFKDLSMFSGPGSVPTHQANRSAQPTVMGESAVGPKKGQSRGRKGHMEDKDHTKQWFLEWIESECKILMFMRSSGLLC